jgi:hypothetical protein
MAWASANASAYQHAKYCAVSRIRRGGLGRHGTMGSPDISACRSVGHQPKTVSQNTVTAF